MTTAARRRVTTRAIGEATTIHSAMEGRRYLTPSVRGLGSSKTKSTRAGKMTATRVWRHVDRLILPEWTWATRTIGPATRRMRIGVESFTNRVAGQNQMFAPVQATPSKKPGDPPVSLLARNFRPST